MRETAVAAPGGADLAARLAAVPDDDPSSRRFLDGAVRIVIVPGADGTRFAVLHPADAAGSRCTVISISATRGYDSVDFSSFEPWQDPSGETVISLFVRGRTDDGADMLLQGIAYDPRTHTVRPY